MPATESEESLVSGDTGRMLAVLAFGSMAGMIGRVVLPPLLPVIIVDLEISSTLAGLTLSAMWAMMASVQYLGGRLSDQTSRKTVLTASLLFMTVAAAFIGGSVVYALFLVGCVLMGLGAGLYPPTANAYLTDLFVKRRGQAFGINTAAINIGGIVAAGLAVVALGFGEWRMAYLPVIGVFLFVVVLLQFWSNETHKLARIEFDLFETAGRMIRRPQIRRIMIANAAIGFAWQGAINFLPTYLQLQKGFQSEMASNVFALLFVVGAVVTPIAGRLGDDIGHLRVASGLIVLGSVGLGALVSFQGQVPSALSVMLFAVGLSGFWPVVSAYMMGRLSDTSMGGDVGAIRTISLSIGALGPTFVGLVAEHLSYGVAFTALLVPFGVALLMLVPLVRVSSFE